MNAFWLELYKFKQRYYSGTIYVYVGYLKFWEKNHPNHAPVMHRAHVHNLLLCTMCTWAYV